MEKYISEGNDPVRTRVVIEQYGERYMAESVYSDTDTVRELLRCLDACAVASSWSQTQVLEHMLDYIRERKDLLSEESREDFNGLDS